MRNKRYTVSVIVLMIILVSGVSAPLLGAERLGTIDSAKHETWSPSPGGAALRSLLFPGWGQSYNQAPMKAVIYGGIEEVLIYSIYRSHRQFMYYKQLDGYEINADNHRDDRNRLTWYLAGAIVMSIMDAYVDAHLFDFDVSDDLSHAPKDNGFMNSGVNVTIGWIQP